MCKYIAIFGCNYSDLQAKHTLTTCSCFYKERLGVLAAPRMVRSAFLNEQLLYFRITLCGSP